jgi:hypothetical protein
LQYTIFVEHFFEFIVIFRDSNPVWTIILSVIFYKYHGKECFKKILLIRLILILILMMLKRLPGRMELSKIPYHERFNGSTISIILIGTFCAWRVLIGVGYNRVREVIRGRVPLLQIMMWERIERREEFSCKSQFCNSHYVE